jgi:hypothetical protein
MKTAERLRQNLRASWRKLLVSMLRLTFRVQDGLELRVKRLAPN